MNSFEMNMERLDREIDRTRKTFYSAVLGKKRRVKRTWLEINALTNAHLLQMLPYRAMLGHVAKVSEERDKVIAEIVASQEKVFENEEESETEKLSSSASDVAPLPAPLERRNSAVQTEESSFTQENKAQATTTG